MTHRYTIEATQQHRRHYDAPWTDTTEVPTIITVDAEDYADAEAQAKALTWVIPNPSYRWAYHAIKIDPVVESANLPIEPREPKNNRIRFRKTGL